MKVSGMMKKNGFVEGAVIATAAVVITKILGMVYVIPFYQIIGSKGGALYSYSYNIYNIFLGISTAGIPIAVSKIISEFDTLGFKEAKKRTFNLAIKITGVLSIFFFLILFIFAEVIAKIIIGDLTGGNTYEEVAFVIRAISFAILVIPYLSVTKGFLQGHKIMMPSSFSNILEQIVRVSVIIFGSFLAYKVFAASLSFSVGIAVSGAFFGGLVAYLYLRKTIKKNKSELGLKEHIKKDSITNKEIIKKILRYSVPFIIINIATSIYNFTDMVLILRGLSILNFNAVDAEFIQSAITTWSAKIGMIISSFAMGMSVSLIPNIVSSAVKKDWKDINLKMNKAYQIILAISIPCSVGLCILAKPVWTCFYGYSEYGSIVLSLSVILAIFANLYSITLNTLQGLNKFRLVYACVFIGLGINALLDIPLMLLLNSIGLPAYWGTIVSSGIGYLLSIRIATRKLKKEYLMSYKSTYVMGAKILFCTAVMSVVLVILNKVVILNYTKVIDSIIMIILNTIVGGTVYLSLGYKLNIFQDVFGKEYLNKILKKLTFNKVSIK